MKKQKRDDCTLEDFLNEFLIRCPHCAQPARVYRTKHTAAATVVKLNCSSCGTGKIWQEKRRAKRLTAEEENRFQFAGEQGVIIGQPVDAYFHEALWLQIPFAGNVLWAYNAAHLRHLQTTHKNRPKILKGLTRLQQLLRSAA